MNVIKRIFRELHKTDDFSSDWYGYATNQLSHFVLGFTAACVFSALHFWSFGEFAEKGALWFTIAFTYAIWELGVQRWRGLDSIEDWVFYSVYGAGAAILLFNETEPGSPILTTSMEYTPPFMALLYGHLAIGIVARIYQKVKDEHRE